MVIFTAADFAVVTKTSSFLIYNVIEIIVGARAPGVKRWEMDARQACSEALGGASAPLTSGNITRAEPGAGQVLPNLKNEYQIRVPRRAAHN
jgi:hypothetical protein